METHTNADEAVDAKQTVLADRPTVAVIIPAFNQARFLAEAIESVLAQTHQADEVIVVDDGSNDDPASVVEQFSKVRLIRQENRGPSAARNTGLRMSSSRYVVFLDSDDRLLPFALEAGLSHMTDRPDCAFVYGGYRLVSESNKPISPDILPAPNGSTHLAMLRNNQVGMVAAVLFRRDRLVEVEGFDESSRRAEDRDLYLRLTRKYPAASHMKVVAEYRKHGKNASDNHVEQLKGALQTLDRYEARFAIDLPTRAALRDGRALKRRVFANEMVREAAARLRMGQVGKALGYLIQSAQWTPYLTMRALLAVLVRRVVRFAKVRDT